MNELLTTFSDRVGKGLRQLAERVPRVLEEPRDYPQEAFVLAAFAALVIIMFILVALVVAEAVRGALERRRLGYRYRWDIAALKLGAALGVVLAALGVVSLLPLVPAVNVACGTCHQIEPRVSAWRGDAHSGVSCYGCHARAGAVGVVQAGAEGVSRLLGARDALAAQAPVFQERCVRCHDEIQTGVISGRIRMRHEDVIAAGQPCLACHPHVGHEKLEREPAAVSRGTMSVCLTCHDGVAAPAGCTVCHDGRPSDSAVQPAAGATRADVTCDGCHQPATSRACVDCHGLVLPHPEDFPGQHARLSSGDPSLCARCHEQAGQRPCDCHSEPNTHGTYNEWFPRHGAAAQIAYPGGCLCHDASFCQFCHGPTFR